ARRQWSLRDDTNLRYRFLAEFDKAMIALVKREKIFEYEPFAIALNNEAQVLIFKRGDIVFFFNFNPVQSFTDYAIDTDKGQYRIILNSDSPSFNGFGRIDEDCPYPTHPYHARHLLKVYLPARTAVVMKKVR
ncbi:MAG: alpha amylase C-terminal domain-containing protein, partial [Prevotellaceae bacterium]|nr:alpha amylase C-terminal domain-containing protein [Prevotellaceae bacterium]